MITRGDIWTVGPHTLMCGDLEAGDALLLCGALNRQPGAAWCDPPYNLRVAKRFREGAGMHEAPDLDRLFVNLIEVLRLVDGPCYVEMGRDGRDSFEAALATKAVSFVTHSNLTYGGGTSQLIVYEIFGRGPIPHGDGWQPAISVLHDIEPTLVLDPCMGVGGFGAIAVKHGHAYAGMELHPDRVRQTIQRLAKHTQQVPEYRENLIHTGSVS